MQAIHFNKYFSFIVTHRPTRIRLTFRVLCFIACLLKCPSLFIRQPYNMKSYFLSTYHIPQKKKIRKMLKKRRKGRKLYLLLFIQSNTPLGFPKTPIVTQFFICLVTNFCFLMQYCLVILQHEAKLILSFSEVLPDVQISV